MRPALARRWATRASRQIQTSRATGSGDTWPPPPPAPRPLRLCLCLCLRLARRRFALQENILRWRARRELVSDLRVTICDCSPRRTALVLPRRTLSCVAPVSRGAESITLFAAIFFNSNLAHNNNDLSAATQRRSLRFRRSEQPFRGAPSNRAARPRLETAFRCTKRRRTQSYTPRSSRSLNRYRCTSGAETTKTETELKQATHTEPAPPRQPHISASPSFSLSAPFINTQGRQQCVRTMRTARVYERRVHACVSSERLRPQTAT